MRFFALRSALALAAVLAVVGTAAPANASDGTPQLKASIPVAPGCMNVTRSSAGIKVFLVQRALGTSYEKERYGPATRAAVTAFQRSNGLATTGVVDEQTWKALGIQRGFCVDEFTIQPMVAANAERDERIEAALAWARAQMGKKYIWGSSGPIGYDCSGLVIQALYAAGVYLPTITTDIHQTTQFGTSSAMYRLVQQRVPFAERQRGDLIFWGNGGSVSHVALYLGDDQVIEAVRPRVHLAGLTSQGYPVKPFVVRVF